MSSLTLTRTRFCSEGIFGELSKDGERLAYTLEHSYNDKPKLPVGEFTCVRGQHRLHGMTADFTTFEVTGVAGHAGILFHWGNYNCDSEGCILLGLQTSETMVSNSKQAFADFMLTMEGIGSFALIVS